MEKNTLLHYFIGSLNDQCFYHNYKEDIVDDKELVKLCEALKQEMKSGGWSKETINSTGCRYYNKYIHLYNVTARLVEPHYYIQHVTKDGVVMLPSLARINEFISGSSGFKGKIAEYVFNIRTICNDIKKFKKTLR